MRLIDTETLELYEFFELQAPAYAILSHTWEKDEITFQEMVTKSPSTMAKAGYKKIHNTCRLAQSRGQKWAWVDTCCIDKSSSAELTESINSMYRWYQKAEECYAYLVDFTPGSLPETELEQCRWFTRGFTLQELIAPKTVILFDREWNVVGEKKNERILHTINRITRISRDVLLLEKPPRDFAIAERMVWASTRKTTRPEDTAYCLLGIFEVHMPLIYGEGDNAFRRLQEEIIKRSTDLSIFAWGTPLNFQTEADKEKLAEDPSCSLFAVSPADYVAVWAYIDMEDPNVQRLLRRGMRGNMDFALTNRGLNIGGKITVGIATSPYAFMPREETYYILYHVHMGGMVLAVLLDKIGPGIYFRRGVRLLSGSFLSRSEGHPFTLSTIPDTILLDHRDLPDLTDRGPFGGSVSITWPSNLAVSTCGASPNTHWDASRSLFFPPRHGDYDVACAELKFVVRNAPGGIVEYSTIYVIIDFCCELWDQTRIFPRAYVLSEADLPAITMLIKQAQIPRHVLFPGRKSQSTHLLNKGPECGSQTVVSLPLGSLKKPQRVIISIDSGFTLPPLEYQGFLGRIHNDEQFTARLHARLEGFGDAVGSGASLATAQ